MALTKISRGLLNTGISDSSDATAITIDSSENVLIGTTTINSGTLGSSNKFLEVAAGTASGSGTLILSRATNTNNDEVGGVRYVNANNADDDGLDADGKMIAAISARLVTTDSNAGDDSGGVLTFSTKPEAGSFTEAMRIDESGRLFIGTTNEYNAEADNLIIYDSGNAGLTIATGSTSGNNTIHFADGTSGDAQYRGVIEYEHNDDSMRFKVNGEQEAMRIDSSGNVGIGTTSPSFPLSVTSSSGTAAEFLGEGGPHGLRIYGNDGGFGAIGHVSTGSYDMMIDSSGRFGFGSLGAATSAQFMRIEAEFSTNRIMRMANRDNSGNSNTLEVGHADNNEGAHILICYHGNNTSGASGDPYNDAVLSLQVNGNLAIDGSFSPNSDRRLKKDITNCSYGLDAINQLIPRTYKGRDVSKEMMGTQIGLIADEVEGIIPEVVSKFGLKADGSTLSKTIVGYGDEEGTEETFDEVKNISYDRLVVVLTKALQEADTKIEDLKTRIETLEGS